MNGPLDLLVKGNTDGRHNSKGRGNGLIVTARGLADITVITNTASSCSSSAPFLAASLFDDLFPQGEWQYYLLSSI